jgi:predicted ABC-type ATPase
MDKEKQIVVVGGPNGSGKSTFADEYVQQNNLPYLGADAIAAELCPQDPFSKRMEAGKQFIHRLKAAIAEGKSMVIESTLSGKGLDKYLKLARTHGYQISVVFVTLDTPALSLARIQERVANGGHHVPDEDVIRRFSRSRQQFWNTFRLLADDWQLFSNIHEGFKLIALGQGDEYEQVDELELTEFLADLENTYE